MTISKNNSNSPLVASNGFGARGVYFSKRCSFWRVSGELTLCFFCEAPTNYILVYRDGSEDWSCRSCLYSRGKIKRFRSDHHKSRGDGKQAILGQKSLVDFDKNMMLGVTS